MLQLTGRDADGRPAEVWCDGPRVAGPPGARADASDDQIDVGDAVLVPGFVDLQCNGAFGIDLQREPERIWDLAVLLARTGVTAWLPTIVTGPPDTIERATATLHEGPPAGLPPHAVPIGLHLEGPFLNPVRKGAHPPAWLRPPTDRGWSATGRIALVTLAPELDGGLDLVRALRSRGIVVSVGHSDATSDQVGDAARAGATMVTHLFNAMRPLHHRDPGVVGAVLGGRTEPPLVAGLIPDGVHVHPTAVAAAWAALGPARVAVVTDAVTPAGLPTAADAVRLGDGTLAGSTLTMDRAVALLQRWTGCTLAEACRAASATPAQVLGDAQRGHLQPGARADVVALAPDGSVVAVVVGGELAWRAGEREA